MMIATFCMCGAPALPINMQYMNNIHAIYMQYMNNIHPNIEFNCSVVLNQHSFYCIFILVLYDFSET